VEESRQGKSEKTLHQLDDKLWHTTKADTPRQGGEAEVEGVVPGL